MGAKKFRQFGQGSHAGLTIVMNSLIIKINPQQWDLDDTSDQVDRKVLPKKERSTSQHVIHHSENTSM